MRELLRRVGAAALRAATYGGGCQSGIDRARARRRASGLAAGVGAHGFGSGRMRDVVFFTMLAVATWAVFAVLTYQLGVLVMAQRPTKVRAAPHALRLASWPASLPRGNQS